MADLNDLRVFERVAALSSFSAAAKALNMPKSSASRAVSRLEQTIGIRLVQRTTREVGLTVAGQALFERCTDLLAGIDDALIVASGHADAPKGLLRISAGIGFGINVLGRQLPGFLARYPEVRVSIDLTSRASELISERVDVAIRMGPLPDSGLVAARLATLTQYLCATPAYLDRHGRPDAPADLARHQLVELASASGRTRPWRLHRGTEEISVEAPARVDVNDALTICALVERGVGIGVITGYLCGTALRERTLERVLPDWSLPPLPVHMVFPSQREISSIVRAFVDYMREVNTATAEWLSDPHAGS